MRVLDQQRHERLSRIWASPPGFWSFLTAVNHRVVGLRFMVTAFVFFLLAGIEAALIRLQLAGPMFGILSADAFNQTFTMHGSTMMFLFAVPFLEGLAIYLVPLMIGARDMSFPRLNAFGYWVFLLAGVSLYGAYLFGMAPDSGWYNYPPLTGPGFRPGVNIDFWVTMITFLEVSALVAAVEIIVTILKQRAPGMSLNRMPVFVWAMLVTAFMILFAMPALVLASLMLGLDRMGGTHFFNAAAGGDPLLWQHLFWFFGHPDVYIMLLPAVGVVSMVIPVFARRPLAGYTLVVVAALIIGILSFGVWVHHMYTVGFALVGLSFFAAASMLITIPSAVQIFAWIVTIWRGRITTMSTALLFSLGFIVLFILGGITGIMIASVPFNWQIHDTYFIVAHFHYVLVGGVVLPIFAGIYFWFPKVRGRLLDERLGRWHFWLFFLGFNLTFFFMHVLGFEGMPRRIYTYQPGLGWGWLNLISTLGTGLMGIATAIFVWNLVTSWRRGAVAGSDPWGGGTLEWAATSPPQSYNFLHVPYVADRDPLWRQPFEEVPPGPADEPAWRREISEARDGTRDQLTTSVVAAEPEGRAILPGPSLWPLWLALALTVAFLGVIVTPVLVPVGLALAFAALVGWHWPSDPDRADPSGGAQAEGGGQLPRQLTGLRSPIIWGVLLLVAIEGTVTALLGVSHLYLRLGTEPWPPDGVEAPGLAVPLVELLLLGASVAPVWFGIRLLRGGRTRTFLLALTAAMGLVAASLGLKVWGLLNRGYLWSSHAYGSLDWTISGYSGFHAGVVLLVAAVVWALGRRGHFGPGRYTGVQALLVYWIFVAASSAALFAVQYLAPHL